MIRVLRNSNILLIYSKDFLFFEWKLEKSDFGKCSTLRSPEFNVGDARNNSFLEISVPSTGSMYLHLYNPYFIAKGYYVLTILGKNISLIKSIHKSTDNFKAVERVDLFGDYGKLPSTEEYPIIVTCTAKSSINDHFSVPNNKYGNRMSEISSDLINVLEQGLNTDIELIMAEESIKAHKVVLQARSPVFRKMFQNDSSEASKNTVVISDIGSTTMKRLVNFLYSGIMDKCNFDEAIELYYAADKYEVLSLREDCNTELLNCLDVTNACLLFTLANRHNDDVLKERVVQFASSNLKQIVNLESMNEMSKEDIILLMRLSMPETGKQLGPLLSGETTSRKCEYYCLQVFYLYIIRSVSFAEKNLKAMWFSTPEPFLNEEDIRECFSCMANNVGYEWWWIASGLSPNSDWARKVYA